MSEATSLYVAAGAFPDGTWGVTVTDPAGYEFTHLYSGRMTEAEALRLEARVRSAVTAKGVEALDDTLWGSRIVYGSLAYQNEEPWIVANERMEG